MAGYWPSSFFLRVYGKLAKKNEANIHLHRKSLVNKGFIVWLWGKLFSWDTADSLERAS